MLLWGGLGGLRRTAAPGEEQAWDGDGHEHSKIPLEMGGCGRRPLHTIPMTARPGCVHGVVRRAQKITAANSRAGRPPTRPLPYGARGMRVRPLLWKNSVADRREARGGGGGAFFSVWARASARSRAVESEAECGSTRVSTLPVGVTPGTVAPGQPQAPRSPWT